MIAKFLNKPLSDDLISLIAEPVHFQWNEEKRCKFLSAITNQRWRVFLASEGRGQRLEELL